MKKALSFLLALMLALVMVPGAYAAEDPVILNQTTIENYRNGSNYLILSGNFKLDGNITVSDGMVFIGVDPDSETVLDLNGHTISAPIDYENHTYNIRIATGDRSKMTIKDSGTGGKINAIVGAGGGHDTLSNFSTTVISGGTISFLIITGDIFTLESDAVVNDLFDNSSIGVNAPRYYNGGTVTGNAAFAPSDESPNSVLSADTKTVFTGTVSKADIYGGEFTGTVTNSDIYGGVFTGTVGDNCTVHESAKRTLSFDPMGGSAIAEQKILCGQKAAEPSAPSKNGSGFMGWYREESYENRWDFSSDRVKSDTTLYARWSTPTDDPSPAPDHADDGGQKGAAAGAGSRSGDGTPVSLGQKKSYGWLEGQSQTVSPGAESARFRADADFSKFQYAYVDGIKLTPAQHKAYSGSTIVELTGSYISSLKAGTHTLRMQFTDGYAETAFYVGNEENPDTGAPAAAWGILEAALISAAVIFKKH